MIPNNEYDEEVDEEQDYDFEEYEERRESSADNAVFPDKVTKRNNEYIFGEELRREKGEELCERCRAVRGRKKR